MSYELQNLVLAKIAAGRQEQVANFCASMAGNSRRYPTGDVGCHTAGRDEWFLAAQEGVLLQVPAAWFGDAWAAQSYGENHVEVFFFGVLEKYNTKSHKFTCRCEGYPKQYPITWDTIFEFVVRSSMQWNSPPRRKSMQVSRSSVLVDSLPSVGESSHARGLEMLNLGIDDAHDAAELALDWIEFVCDVAEEASPDLEGTTHAHRGRERSPKSRKRGGPKGSSMHGKEQCTNPSPEYRENGDDDNDEHASEGEGVECGDDEALEAEGPVLDDTPDADLNFVDVVPPEWQSGDRMEQEPLDTFWSLPAFNELVGLDLGHTPREFTEFHLWLMLFPLDLVDHIIHETNMYANLQREMCQNSHESMRRWVPLDRHSFLRFMGMALGMPLHYMPSKTHYWKDDMMGSLHFPNFGEKMSHTSFQQIKRFLHLRDNAQRSPRVYDKVPCPELSFHVVANLVKALPRQGHHVFFDRYFTSVKLLEHLPNERQGGTGTYVSNRKNFPGMRQVLWAASPLFCDSMRQVSFWWTVSPLFCARSRLFFCLQAGMRQFLWAASLVIICGKFLFGGQAALFFVIVAGCFFAYKQVCGKFYGSRVSYWWTAMSLFVLATGFLLLTGR
ncbi:hypothetical protein L7F22_063198 [Adiantum nelumboides]|nr:hypothetical protein [Adiantum nelumboides]